MTWMYKGEFIRSIPIGNEPVFGFVYIITNTINGRRYLGCKQFFTYKTKNKQKIVKESGWASYYGSSTELAADIKTYGKSNFTREIIRFCSSKRDLLYYEAKYQMTYGVLESEQWYNKWIRIKIGKMI